MHYIDVGQGDPIVFLHGNPTSSYLWRNIIPHLSDRARCIAPDLIGMGKSDKPDIGYTFNEHYAYLEEFIQKLGLTNVTLVIHDWGSGLGFHYANQHRDTIKGIAFMEAMVKPMEWNEMPPEYRLPFKLFRAPFTGWLMISVFNMFLNVMVHQLTQRRYTKQEIAAIKAPYRTINSRKPIRVWPQEIPLGGKPQRTYEPIAAYAEWLPKSSVPKLLLYAHPGGIIKEAELKDIRDTFTNIEYVDVGEGVHYIQEDHPRAIGQAIRNWYAKINAS